MAGGVRAAAQAPQPTHLPLNRLCTNRRVAKGGQEAAILSSVQEKEEENFIETQERDGGTDKSNGAHGRLRPRERREQPRNATSGRKGAGWPPVPFRPAGRCQPGLRPPACSAAAPRAEGREGRGGQF